MKTIKTTLLVAVLVSLLLPVRTSAQKTQESRSASASAAAAAAPKLDPAIKQAVQQSRQSGVQGHNTMPTAAIPVREGDKILVDLTTTKVSDDLRNQIVKLGGKIMESPDPHHVVRIMMPLQQMEALASRSDVVTVVPAQLSYTSGSKPISR